jgi:hypothetical protein
MPNPTDTNIDENELLAAVRANLAESAEDKEDKGGESAIKIDNPLDPEANVDKEPVVEAAAVVPPVEEPVVEHLGDGSSVQKHSAGELYPWIVYAQQKDDAVHYGVMSPMDQTGKLYGPDYMTAYNTAAAEKTAHGEKFKNSSVTESVVDIKDILSGNDQLSEEFKEKAAIIFNTAVRMQVEAIQSKLEEQFTEKKTALESSHEELAKNLQEKFETQLSEACQKFEETLSEKIDGYFGALSEEWMHENELALEGGIQAELVESFISGMRGLFEQHYVEMPEEKRDLLSEATAKVAELEKSVASLVAESTEAKSTAAKLLREKIISESAHGMTELDASRFKTLMEDFDFDGEESFSKKAQTVKESFFKTKAALIESKTTQVEHKPAVQPQVELVEEKVIPVTEAVTSPMDMYVKHIKGQSA